MGTRVMVVVVAGALAVSACGLAGVKSGPTETLHKVVELDKAALTRVTLTMAGGELDVKGGAASLLDANFTYNVPEWKPVVEHRTSGAQADLEITQGTKTSVMGESKNQWDLSLNDAMPIEFNAHIGAGDVRLKLGGLNLRRVDVQMGAGDVDIDLRGQPRTSYKASIHGGVGTATVHVPANVAVSATASGGIGSISVDGLEKRAIAGSTPSFQAVP